MCDFARPALLVTEMKKGTAAFGAIENSKLTVTPDVSPHPIRDAPGIVHHRSDRLTLARPAGNVPAIVRMNFRTPFRWPPARSAVVALALALVAILAAGCVSHSAASGADFVVSRLDGAQVQLHPDRTTRAWVFTFLSVDCPISNRALPELNELAHDFSSQGIRFIFVYPNADELPEAILQHQREFGLTGELFRDPGQALVRQLEVKVTPEVVAVTARGKPIYRGRINDQYLALGQSRPAPTRHDLAEVLREYCSGSEPTGQSRPPVGCSIHPAL